MLGTANITQSYGLVPLVNLLEERVGGNMLPAQIKTFREIITVADGTRILLRPMVKDDHNLLVELYSSINGDDLRYFRHNVKDPGVLKEWSDNLDYNKVIPLIALVKDLPVGNASLHFGEGPRRHIGEVRIFLTKDFRKRGLGMKMLKAIVDIARKQGLHILTAEVIAENVRLIKAFESLGFKQQFSLDDYFMFPDGECIDVKFMVMPLKVKVDQF
jgi:RimJ/RimL family protein N-acetyltransferase